VAASPTPPDGVRLLDEDPDLGDALDRNAFAAVRSATVAPLIELQAGRWQPSRPAGDTVFGFLVLDGVIGSRVVIPERSHLELLAPGDVIRPWVGLGPDASIPGRVDWRVLEPCRLALLDRRFADAVRDFPEVWEALADRLVMRARRLNFLLAVNSVTRLEERILLALWHFGERWGRVTADGVYLGFRLTHRDLADVVGASRPSVSSALMAIRRQGAIEQRDAGWLLRGSPPVRFSELKAEAELTPRGRETFPPGF
jgi:CRP/FNR family transcriptional regulator, cyclic AMP receptor protein